MTRQVDHWKHSIVPSCDLIPTRAFAGRLGSALQPFDRSTAAWASLKRSAHIRVGSPPQGELQPGALSQGCLNEVGEADT